MQEEGNGTGCLKIAQNNNKSLPPEMPESVAREQQ
jgi:hypothetical protein